MAATLLQCCGRRSLNTKNRPIYDRNGHRVSSYTELNTIDLPRERPTQQKPWRAGWYPVEVLTRPDKEGYVTVHYTGWSSVYDAKIKHSELQPKGNQSLDNTLLCSLEQLKVSIKENLASSGKLDSKVTIRHCYDKDLFNLLQGYLSIYKRTRTKTIFKISTRDQLSLLGNEWDYRILNREGDCCYIKTETLRMYKRNRRDLKTFALNQGGRIEEKPLPRGQQIVITFVKCSGNNRMLEHLVNDPVL